MSDVLRSTYSTNQQLEEESKTHVKFYFNRQGWKFRDVEQDNDIDNEIEVFEAVGNKNETSAKFIKVQMKSTNELKVVGDEIFYQCPVKFLHFCDVCDVPILLFIYDGKTKEAFWVWVQWYIYHILDKEKPNWRENKSTVTLKVSTKQIIADNDEFFDSLRNIAYQGISEISQMRKYNSVGQYYTVVELNDISTVTDRRLTAKVLVDKSFSSSNDAMKSIIPKINEEIRRSDYFKTDESKRRFEGRAANVVWLFFYNDVNQVQNGLPIIRTQWIDDSTKIRPMELKPDDTVSGVKITWERNNESFTSVILHHRLSKGEYLSKISLIHEQFCDLFEKTNKQFHLYIKGYLGYEKFLLELRSLKKPFDNMYFGITDMGFPPFECDSLHKVLLDLVSMLHNVSTVVGNENYREENVRALVRSYIDHVEKNIHAYTYERSKVR